MRFNWNSRVNAGRVLSVLSAAALLAGAAPAKDAAAQQVTLRMHTHVPSVAQSFKNLEWWARQVEKSSGGKLKIQLFGSMQLGGKAPDVYDQVKNGVVDIGWTLPGYKAGLFSSVTVFELPFIGATADIVSPAIDAYVRKYGKDFADVHVIVMHGAGQSGLHMKGPPIRTLEDFKGKKIRTPSRISSAALTALGATPVPIPGLKMTEALMHNVVDGAVVPWSIARAIRTIDVVDSHTDTLLHGPVLAMLMNKRSYEKLPADLKKAIDDHSGEPLAKEFGRRWVSDDIPGRKKAAELKHVIYDLPAAEEARWRKVTQPVYDDWVKTMTEKGYPGAQMVADAEALVAKYKAAAK